MITNFFESIIILEPWVLISDILLSAACFLCYFGFMAKAGNFFKNGFARYWRRFFLFEGISFFLGGLAHGLYAYFGDVLHFLSWDASIIGVSYFTWGMIKVSFVQVKRFVSISFFAAIMISAVASVVFNAFWIVVVYCFLCMFAVIVANSHSKVMSFKKSQSKGILIGTTLFILAAALHLFRIGVFNVESAILSHIAIAVGILFFGRGCLDTIDEISEENKDYINEIAGGDTHVASSGQ